MTQPGQSKVEHLRIWHPDVWHTEAIIYGILTVLVVAGIFKYALSKPERQKRSQKKKMLSSIQANTDKSIDNIHQANLIAEQRLIQRKQERRRLYALEKTKIKPDHKLDPWDASRPKGYWNQSELFCLPPALSKSAHDLSTFNIRLEAMPRNNSVPPTSLALSKSFAGLLNSKGRNDQNKNDKQRLYQLMSVVKTIPMNDNRVEADSDKLESETEMDTNNDILFNRNNGDSHTAMYTDSTSNAKSANTKSSPASKDKGISKEVLTRSGTAFVLHDAAVKAVLTLDTPLTESMISTDNNAPEAVD